MSADSITVACPSCKTRCRVPGGVLQFKCPTCQTVCRIGGTASPSTSSRPAPAASRPAPAASRPATPSSQAKPTQPAPSFANQAPAQANYPNNSFPSSAMFPGAAIPTVNNSAGAGANAPGSPSDSSSSDDAAKKPKMNANLAICIAAGVVMTLMLIFGAVAFAVMSFVEPTVAEVKETQPAPLPVIEYREVNLPETLRQKIYLDMKTAELTTTGAKVPLPKDSQVGQFVQNNLQKVLDREATLQGLANNVSEEDIQEIVKEGKAKGW